jgi:hypothetical protein
MDTTYANSMMPDDYIKIYFKAKNDNGEIRMECVEVNQKPLILTL